MLLMIIRFFWHNKLILFFEQNVVNWFMKLIHRLKEFIDIKIFLFLFLINIVSAQRFDIRTTYALYENIKIMTVDNDVLVIGRGNNPNVGRININNIQAVQTFDITTNTTRGFIIGVMIAIMIRILISPQIRGGYYQDPYGIMKEIFWIIFFATIGGGIGVFIGSHPIPGEIYDLTQMTKVEKIVIVKTLLEN